MCRSVIIIGAGGHGKVVIDAAIKAHFTVAGFLDDALSKVEVLGVRRLGALSDIQKFAKTNTFVCALGANQVRHKFDLSETAKWTTVIHSSAQLGLGVKIDKGTVVLANAVINASAQIGRHCIINTGAIIEHDCSVSDYAHISPGAVLCGGVKIGEESWIGAGAVVKNGVSVCSGVIVGAGAVVAKDITEAGVYVGVPAKRR
jgi:sugar O-acyltransferase (sialic acid O-acetyltransferase NeuD family)